MPTMSESEDCLLGGVGAMSGLGSALAIVIRSEGTGGRRNTLLAGLDKEAERRRIRLRAIVARGLLGRGSLGAELSSGEGQHSFPKFLSASGIGIECALRLLRATRHCQTSRTARLPAYTPWLGPKLRVLYLGDSRAAHPRSPTTLLLSRAPRRCPDATARTMVLYSFYIFDRHSKGFLPSLSSARR